jgi:type III secretion protein S
MDTDNVLTLTRQAIILVLWLGGPPIVVAAVVGLLTSLVQALTQLQDQTTPFAIKIVAVFVTLLLTGGWIGSQMLLYGERIMLEIAQMR